MALRSLDDVKESVRTAGTGLVRGLRGTCLRLMDASQTTAVGALGLPVLCKLAVGATAYLGFTQPATLRLALRPLG